jgi:hypothetical protein
MNSNQFQQDFTQQQNLGFNLHKELQRHLQMQEDQMKCQFDLQLNQPNLLNLISMIGTNAYRQFMPTATSSVNNLFENNDLRGQLSQNQGLNYLPEN